MVTYMAKRPTKRTGDWCQTYTGEVYWPLDPRPEEVHMEDIAHALSMQCRFNGHCKYFYSVAQHSVFCALAVSPEAKAWALMHDAAEAYLHDLPRPLKPFLEGYGELEEKNLFCIAKRFGLIWPIPKHIHDEIKEVDLRMLATEKAHLMQPCVKSWNLPHPPYERLGEMPVKSEVHLRSWNPGTAKSNFWYEAREYKVIQTPRDQAELNLRDFN